METTKNKMRKRKSESDLQKKEKEIAKEYFGVISNEEAENLRTHLKEIRNEI